MKRILFVVASVGAMALTAMVASATIIDSFDATPMTVSANIGSQYNTVAGAVATNCIGGYRRLAADYEAGTIGAIMVECNNRSAAPSSERVPMPWMAG